MRAWFRPRIDGGRCDRCGRCAVACPHGVIRMAQRWHINWLSCDGCGECASACPLGALRIEGGEWGTGAAGSAWQSTTGGPQPPAAIEDAPPNRGARDHGAASTQDTAKWGRMPILYLPGGAPGNVLAAVQAVADRFARGDLDSAVVASLSGSTAVLLARAMGEMACRLVCVADTPDWIAYGHPYPTLDEGHHRELLERGVRILRDYRSASAGMPRFDPALGEARPLSAAEAALFWDGVAAVGGEGVKTAVKSVVLATEYGLLRRGERVVSLGGGGGREAAVVMDAAGHAEILSGATGTRLRVQEIVCMAA